MAGNPNHPISGSLRTRLVLLVSATVAAVVGACIWMVVGLQHRSQAKKVLTGFLVGLA